jgi:hypothetical protein
MVRQEEKTMTQTTEQGAREDPRAWNDNRERKAVTPERAIPVVKAPGFLEKLREAHLSKKGVFGMMLVAAVLTMLVGFNWGGWVTGANVQKQVSAATQKAVTLRLAPICVSQFNLDTAKAAKLTELKAITSSYGQVDYVKKQGWATMPGETRADDNVAGACAKLLIGS